MRRNIVTEDQNWMDDRDEWIRIHDVGYLLHVWTLPLEIGCTDFSPSVYCKLSCLISLQRLFALALVDCPTYMYLDFQLCSMTRLKRTLAHDSGSDTCLWYLAPRGCPGISGTLRPWNGDLRIQKSLLLTSLKKSVIGLDQNFLSNVLDQVGCSCL